MHNLSKILNYGDKIQTHDYIWTVEKELHNMYEIFYGFVVTHIPKDKIQCNSKSNQYEYHGKLPEIEDPFEEVKQYVTDFYEVKL